MPKDYDTADLVAAHILDLAKRQITIEKFIDMTKAEQIIRAITALTRIDASSSIELVVNSQGGRAEAGVEIAKKIIECGVAFNGTVVGSAWSAAFNIFQYCVRRRAVRTATLLLHAPYIAPDNTVWGEPIILHDDPAHLLSMSLLAMRTGHPVEKIARWAVEEREFTADEALRLRLIDEIVDS
jgi:ATP-dependent protease ClpP protease subunit